MARIGRIEGLKMIETIKSIELPKGVKENKIQSITAEYSRIHMLVNNTGYAVIGTSGDLDMEEKKAQYETNLWCHSVTQAHEKTDILYDCKC